jgi:hypothetical protein
VAQRLDRDVLSVIFALASTNWVDAALTLSSVCRLWRYTALSMPQMWSRIDLRASTSSCRLRVLLKCSKALPLHIAIPSSASKKQLKVLAAATDRIVCMRIIDRFCFLRNRFPVLERLKLDHNQGATSDGLQYLSEAPRFPRLKEFSVQIVPLSEPYEMVALRPTFAGLQKLEISCWLSPHWLKIIRWVSSTLVSLALRIWSCDDRSLHKFSFPRLRHLKITKIVVGPRLMLKLDAPHLECVERVFKGHGWATRDGVLIILRYPRSVKQLHLMAQDLDLSPYPAIQKLWIYSYPPFNDIMLPSLRRRITSCPELETILYCDPRGEAKAHEYQYSRPSEMLSAIFNVVRRTRIFIGFRTFFPNELDLPEDIRPSVRIVLWFLYHRD